MSDTDHRLRPVAVEDARQFSPSAARNCVPIREVLTRVLPKKGIVLEIGSGTGEHVVCFAKALPRLVWLPSRVAHRPERATRRRAQRGRFAAARRQFVTFCVGYPAEAWVSVAPQAASAPWASDEIASQCLATNFVAWSLTSAKSPPTRVRHRPSSGSLLQLPGDPRYRLTLPTEEDEGAIRLCSLAGR